MLIPWSAFWERNYFVDWSPALKSLLASNYTRGAVTGLGLLNVWSALAELAETFATRKSPPDTEPESPINNHR